MSDGVNAGQSRQGTSAVAIGTNAGLGTQGSGAIAIGSGAGQSQQGQNSIAIGTNAGITGQASNSIILNSNGNIINSTASNSIVLYAGVTASALSFTQSGFYVNPINSHSATPALTWDSSTSQIAINTTYSAPRFDVATTTTNASYYPVFVGSTSGSASPFVNTNFSFNPSTSVIAVGTGSYQYPIRGNQPIQIVQRGDIGLNPVSVNDSYRTQISFSPTMTGINVFCSAKSGLGAENILCSGLNLSSGGFEFFAKNVGDGAFAGGVGQWIAFGNI